MQYTTKHLRNLMTGEPFVFEVSEGDISNLETQRYLVRAGRSIWYQSIEQLEISFEFSRFPAFEDLLKIFFKNGYTDELMKKILIGFGITEALAQRFTGDDNFVSRLKGLFEGITSDGERSVRTLQDVYLRAQVFLKMYLEDDAKSLEISPVQPALPG